MKKILITGVTGFVGKHLATHLLSQNSYYILGTYRSEKGLDTLGDLKERITPIKLDLTNGESVEKLLTEEKPDGIFHLAAQASPAKSFNAPVETLTNNIVSEFSILDAMQKHKLHNTRLVVISTSEIY